MRQTDVVTLPTNQLRIGMYVLLPANWLDHPFLRNRFLISSEEQLRLLRASKLKTVQVQLSKSRIDRPNKPSPGQTKSTAPASKEAPSQPSEKPKWDPDSLIPSELHQALQDQSLSSHERAKAVYQHSLELMKRVLESPTAANLKASKPTVCAITDMILSDDQAAAAMLKITNHDFYTYTHSVNVGVISIMLAKALLSGSDAHNLHELGYGFFMHDLGKVAVRPEVINKPGPLTDAEMRHMRIHPYQGYKLMKEGGLLTDEARVIIMQHHERDDGSGYPNQLTGDDIHLYGKICCIADVYDALTAQRSYKQAMSPFVAVGVMQNQMSTNFDKKLFDAFNQLMG